MSKWNTVRHISLLVPTYAYHQVGMASTHPTTNTAGQTVVTAFVGSGLHVGVFRFFYILVKCSGLTCVHSIGNFSDILNSPISYQKMFLISYLYFLPRL